MMVAVAAGAGCSADGVSQFVGFVYRSQTIVPAAKLAINARGDLNYVSISSGWMSRSDRRKRGRSVTWTERNGDGANTGRS